MMTTGRWKLTQPLESVTVIFGALLLAFVALVTVSTLTGSGSFLGFGHAPICATLPGTYGSGNWTSAGVGITASPGTSIAVNGGLQACIAHPGTSLLNTVPLHALLPVSALAGAALLTFARITRLGAAMDDEIRGTV